MDTWGMWWVLVPTTVSAAGIGAWLATRRLAPQLASARNHDAMLQANAALMDSEVRFKALTALSSDWFWEQDAEFRFVRLDGDLELTTGISTAAHVGLTRAVLGDMQNRIRAMAPLHETVYRKGAFASIDLGM